MWYEYAHMLLLFTDYLFGSFGLSTKGLIQSCFVYHCYCQHQHWHWHHCSLCTVLPVTCLDIEASYLIKYVHMALVYAHQIVRDSNL